MGRFIARRLLQAIPTLLGIMVLTFVLTRLSPADPVSLMVAGAYDTSQADRDALRQALGLNDPLPLQFVHWFWNVLHLDFGNSFYTHRPVLELIGERIPNSLQLAIAGLLLSLLIGAPLG